MGLGGRREVDEGVAGDPGRRRSSDDDSGNVTGTREVLAQHVLRHRWRQLSDVDLVLRGHGGVNVRCRWSHKGMRSGPKGLDLLLQCLELRPVLPGVLTGLHLLTFRLSSLSSQVTDSEIGLFGRCPLVERNFRSFTLTDNHRAKILKVFLRSFFKLLLVRQRSDLSTFRRQLLFRRSNLLLRLLLRFSERTLEIRARAFCLCSFLSELIDSERGFLYDVVKLNMWS